MAATAIPGTSSIISTAITADNTPISIRFFLSPFFAEDPHPFRGMRVFPCPWTAAPTTAAAGAPARGWTASLGIPPIKGYPHREAGGEFASAVRPETISPVPPARAYRAVKNVLIIGTNTQGCMFGNVAHIIRLPSSGCAVSFDPTPRRGISGTGQVPARVSLGGYTK